jgi:hypothetical protein
MLQILGLRLWARVLFLRDFTAAVAAAAEVRQDNVAADVHCTRTVSATCADDEDVAVVAANARELLLLAIAVGVGVYSTTCTTPPGR